MSSRNVLIGNVGPYIEGRKEFQMSSTLRGTYMYEIDRASVYVVLSYDTPIGIYIPRTKTWVLNPAEYSPTSTKHLDILVANLDAKESRHVEQDYDTFIRVQDSLRIHAFHPVSRNGNKNRN